MTKEIKINWNMRRPPMEPTDWVSINAERESTASEKIIEIALNLPPATLAYLETGFAMGLTRKQGWLLEEYSPGAITAAEMFRRGVSWRKADSAIKPSEQSGSYDIKIVEKEWQPGELACSEAFYIIDEEVWAAWPQVRGLGGSLRVVSDEREKTMTSVAKIVEAAASHKASRWCVIGGGLVSDVAAFAAYLSQKPIEFVPTTLLAMADACVGGKTGVNFPPFGKNQVGAFYFPTAVTVWRGWLDTLDERHLRGGMNECIKHALLSPDPNLLEMIKSPDYEWIDEIIRVKAEIVTKDPTEKGERAILNFGHTLAHALEALSHSNTSEDVLLHGEAVGVGMLFALHLSRHCADLPESSLRALVDKVKQFSSIPTLAEIESRLGAELESSLDATIKLMRQDKKRKETDGLPFVLLKERGLVKNDGISYITHVSSQEIAEAWSGFVADIKAI